MASHYQVMEELGSELTKALFIFIFIFFGFPSANCILRLQVVVSEWFTRPLTGPTARLLPLNTYAFMIFDLRVSISRLSFDFVDPIFRSISSPARTIFKKSSRKFLFWLPALAPTLHNTRPVSLRGTNYGLLWNTSEVAPVWIWYVPYCYFHLEVYR